jgi:hypothetical protein
VEQLGIASVGAVIPAMISTAEQSRILFSMASSSNKALAVREMRPSGRREEALQRGLMFN